MTEYVPLDHYRADLADFRSDLARFREEIHVEIAGLRTELHKEIGAQTKWFCGYVTVLAGLAIAVSKLFY